MYNKDIETRISDRLLATHIANNADFTTACMAGNATKIKTIVDTEMIENHLFTKGSQKLKADILRMLGGKEKVTSCVGQRILMFVWNSKLSGIGLAVN
jgi:hypothetical protein